MNEKDKFDKFLDVLRQIQEKGGDDAGISAENLTQSRCQFAVTTHELGRLYHAWRVAFVEGFLESDADALAFESLLKAACLKGDTHFLGQLTRMIENRGSYRPWVPKTALEKIRLAYVSLDPVFHPSWDDVKELATELFDLKLAPRQWQRLRHEAGLSGLPGRGPGRPKKDKGREGKIRHRR